MDVRMGEVIAEGKTKIVRSVRAWPDMVLVESKDDITAGNGVKHDVIVGKGEWATTTTSNVFFVLGRSGIPVAFDSKLDKTHFWARKCAMLPYEVVVRRSAYGSYCKQHPDIKKGTRFPELKVEFFLKTSGKQWSGVPIPVDDPLISWSGWALTLYRPDKPLENQQPLLLIKDYPGKDLPGIFDDMWDIAKKTFEVLEVRWARLGLDFADCKVEFGIDAQEKLLLADVVDNDSWRLLENGEHLDKQAYRDGAPLSEVARRYARVAELSSQPEFRNILAKQ